MYTKTLIIKDLLIRSYMVKESDDRVLLVSLSRHR